MPQRLADHRSRVRVEHPPEPEPSHVVDKGGRIQGVEGGRVRRIIFQGGRTPRTAPVTGPGPETSFEEVRSPQPGERLDLPLGQASLDASQEPGEVVFQERRPPLRGVHTEAVERYHPRHRVSIEEIEREIDRRLRGGGRVAPPVTPDRAEEVYRSEGGRVRAAYGTDGAGREHRVLYVSERRGVHEQDRRFHPAMVDRIIAGVGLEEEVVVEEVVTEPAGKKPRKTGRRAAKKAEKAKGRKKRIQEPVGVAPAPAMKTTEQKEYQPQCEAVTKDGKQCRNSARHGSKYCGAHKGYRPQALEYYYKDTKPRAAKAEDTLPGKEARQKDAEAQPQCAAYTKNGDQCRNSARHGSKYCGAHKGYRAPTKAQLEARLDTKPRVAKAADTKPSLKQLAKRKATKKGSGKKSAK